MLNRFHVWVVVALWLSAGSVASAVTVDEVIAKNIEARGGLEALRAIDTLRSTGQISMGGGMLSPFVLYHERPDRIRLEFTLQGMTAIQAYDGETGWTVMPFTGHNEPAAMSAEQMKQILDQADFEGPLIDHARKGHTVELLGLVEVDGTRAYKLEVAKANGDLVHSYLDADRFLEVKQEVKTTVEGLDMTIHVSLGDYQEAGGILWPHSIEALAEGLPATQSITYQQIEINVEIPDDLFSMPAATEAAADR